MYRTLLVIICALVVFAAAEDETWGQLQKGDILLKSEWVSVPLHFGFVHKTVEYEGVNIIIGIIFQIKINTYFLLIRNRAQG